MHLDDRAVAKRVGLIILATDHTTEQDFSRLVTSDQIGVYTSRVAFANPVTRENLRAMEPSLTASAALLLPDEPLDVVIYSCTSASVMIGDNGIERAIREAKPHATVVTPTAAAVAAFRAIGAKKISVLTPYTLEVSEAMADFFVKNGLEVDRLTYLNLTDDREMARLSHDDIVSLAVEATGENSDAVFVSCTGVRAAAVINRIEERIGRPAGSSNFATAWMCLRLCNSKSMPVSTGRLMSLPLP